MTKTATRLSGFILFLLTGACASPYPSEPRNVIARVRLADADADALFGNVATVMMTEAGDVFVAGGGRSCGLFDPALDERWRHVLDTAGFAHHCSADVGTRTAWTFGPTKLGPSFLQSLPLGRPSYGFNAWGSPSIARIVPAKDGTLWTNQDQFRAGEHERLDRTHLVHVGDMDEATQPFGAECEFAMYGVGNYVSTAESLVFARLPQDGTCRCNGATCEGEIVALDISTGTPTLRWVIAAPPGHSGTMIRGDVMHFVTADEISARDPMTGAVAWQTPAPNRTLALLTSWGDVVTSGAKLEAANQDGRVYSVDVGTELSAVTEAPERRITMAAKRGGIFHALVLGAEGSVLADYADVPIVSNVAATADTMYFVGANFDIAGKPTSYDLFAVRY